MQLEYRLLSDQELADGLRDLDGWSVADGRLTKTFTFATYAAGLGFAISVGCVADRIDHHPDLFVGHAKVEVAMNTHAVGGLSPYDLELARRIEAIG